MTDRYEVIVVGGGHAGAEAAGAAGRMGASVLLVTSTIETIGQMSCNPAIGGVAKGTVVREVDALGGIMGWAADQSTLQFRMLNRSKGPAVWAPRAQCDRGLYRRGVRRRLDEHLSLRVIQGTVASICLDGDRAAGVLLEDGRSIECTAIVLTAGTFLRGKMHIGTDTRIAGGRAGDAPVVRLAQQLEAIGLRVDRFKTGTPPRVDGRTVQFERTERQDGELPEYRFSQLHDAVRPTQLPCWITWAGAEVQEIIRRRMGESALYGGAIAGRGPRYCPSIEDKIVKFPDAPRHQVFLEPEGLDTSELYVNGLSTSLPVDAQEEFLRAIPGLAECRMTRPGYAIEYDYYPPDQLKPSLELKAVPGLFFAGQINGTTGYEEAAGQGLIAGINAVRRVRQEGPVVLPRNSAYIGVLVDDLVTRGVDEPYRLFTSRSEYRLLLRQDNALRRLGGLAMELGLLGEEAVTRLEKRLAAEDEVRAAAQSMSVQPDDVNQYLQQIEDSQIVVKQRVVELVRRPRVRLKELGNLVEGFPTASDEALLSVEVEMKYEGYLERERRAASKLSEMAHITLSADLPYEDFRSLSTEARQKLASIQPLSMAQAGRIPGVSPSDLQNLMVEIRKIGRAVA